MFLFLDATYRMLVRYHPTIGHLYVPDIVARLPNERGGYLVRTNSAGFRSDLQFEPARGPRPRILVFGDSFTAADGCRNDRRYAELVGAHLNAEVYNFGLSGTAPDQHSLIYEHFGRHIDADLVIWGVSVHNIERIKLKHRPSLDRVTGRQVLVPKPYFDLDGASLELRHVPVPRARRALAADEESRYEEEGRIDAPLLQRMYDAPLLRGLRARSRDLFPGARARARGLAYRVAGVQLYDDYLDERSLGWRLLSATIERFHALAGDVPVLIVPLPTYHYYVDRLKPVYQPRFDGLANPDEGLFVYGLTSDLVRGKSLSERQRICFAADAHYSEYGHAEIARLVADEVERLGLLPSRPPVVTQLTPSPHTDVARHCTLALVSGQGGAGAALLTEGRALAAAEEAWFTRAPDAGVFPMTAANHCLEEARIHQNALEACVFVGASDDSTGARPTVSDDVPGEWSAPTSPALREAAPSHPLRKALMYSGTAYVVGHGAAQCASAFHPSPFEAAAVLSVHDSVDGTVASVAVGSGDDLRVIAEVRGAVGLPGVARRVARLLGLAEDDALAELALVGGRARGEDVAAVTTTLLRFADDGAMWTPPFDEGAARGALGLAPETVSAERRGEVAGALLSVVRAGLARMAAHAREVAGHEALCVVGGAFADPEALEPIRAGGALYAQQRRGPVSAGAGAATLVWLGSRHGTRDALGALPTAVGPAFSDAEVEAFLDTHDFPAHAIDEARRLDVVAELLSRGRPVGYFAGRVSGCDVHHARALLVRATDLGDDAGMVSFGGRSRPARPWRGDAVGERFEVGEGGVAWVPLQLAGEPAALTPFDAYRCMMVGRLDSLVLQHYLLHRDEQPPWPERV